MTADVSLTTDQLATLLRLTLREVAAYAHRAEVAERNEVRTREDRTLPCTCSPELRGQLVQLCVQIRGRGDAGHLLPRVAKIEKLMGAKS